ncbi:MAG TPA: Gldg family protein, partial [Planctomycetota bacterium]|nr:Gldg family protein [Planctomycetota bacterium]
MADSREFRSKFYLTNLIFLALVLGVLVLVNATSNRASRFRLDLSADQIYSLSPSTVKILEKLKDQIKVTYYASENLDDFIGTLRRDTLDLFEELYRVSDGKFEYKVVDPERQIESESLAKVDAYMKLYSEKKFTELEEPEVQDIFAMLQGAQQPSAEERRKQREELASQLAARTKRNQNEVYRELLTAEWKEKLENELAQQGVQALVGRQQKADAVSQFKTYSSIKIEYLNKEAEVIPRHASIEGLEYELANRIVKLTTDVKPTVAFFDSRKADVPSPSPFTNAPPPRSDYAAIVDHLRNLFDVREIALT